MKKTIKSIFFGLALLFVELFAQTPVERPFITVSGPHFFRQGKPYYFFGANMWYGAYLGADSSDAGRGRLRRELDRLQAIGVTNLRVLAASEGMGEYQPMSRTIQPRPGQYDEQLLRGLDFLLDEMAKRGMYAVLYLNNYWLWSGGMAQYMAWTVPTLAPKPFAKEYDFDFMALSGLFYTEVSANELFQQYLQRLLNRRNTINHKPYRDDPTIMAWQLANEPRPHPRLDREQAFSQLIAWAEQTAAYIHRLDPNHLVCTGNEGQVGCLGSRECFLRLHKSPVIDYITIHLWPGAWGWFDPHRAEETYPLTVKNALGYIEQHIQDAQALGKPLTLEEFGIARDEGGHLPSDPTTLRDRYYELLLDAVYQSAASGSPMAGSNVWAWSGEGRARDPQTLIWQPGDAFLGDPTPEKQGGNSIFDSDSTTLTIFKNHAAQMRQLFHTRQ